MSFRSRAFAVVLLVLTVSWPAAAQVPAGESFTVNAPGDWSRGSPDVAVGPDGGFAIAWRSSGQDGDGWGVFARWYDHTGASLTGEVQVNSVAAGHQRFFEMDDDGMGNPVIVWVDEARGVVVRRFDSAGVPVSDEVVVGSGAAVIAAAISVSEGGSFLVAWVRADSSTRHVEARRYGSDGLPLGDFFTVSSFTHGWFSEEAAVTLRDDGSFLVTWSDGAEVFGRLYDSAGDPIAAEFQISQLDPISNFSLQLDAGWDEAGQYRVFWATDLNLEEVGPMTRTVTGWGALGDLTQLDFPSHGALGYSMTGDGDFVITRGWMWGERLGGARFDAQHTLWSAFDIEQYSGPNLTLRNGTLAHGDSDFQEFVTVWTNDPYSGGPPYPEIRARRFLMGIFTDGFECGTTSMWSAASP